MPTDRDIHQFQQIVRAYYKDHGRQLPWRQAQINGNFDAYKILVSEIMLQQTQASRVIPKYLQFLERYPTVEALAKASLGEVLTAWNGLGYNRRAKYLHEAAQHLVSRVRPWTFQDLILEKGIGTNTAAAICVYAFNQPLIFVETNIRTVFIHHFFVDKTDVADKDILPILELVLKGQDPRTFYGALMDYGSHLKMTTGNAATHSRHYVKRSAFAGSRRQLRGRIIRLLTIKPSSQQSLLKTLADERSQMVLAELVKEGLIVYQTNSYRLAES